MAEGGVGESGLDFTSLGTFYIAVRNMFTIALTAYYQLLLLSGIRFCHVQQIRPVSYCR